MKKLLIAFLILTPLHLINHAEQMSSAQDLDLYKIKEKMRILMQYCDHIHRIDFKASSKKLTATSIKQMSFQIRRYYQDQVDLYELDPKVFESNYLVDRQSFSEVNDACKQKVAGLERDLKVVDSLKNIVLMCLSSDYLDDSENTEAIKRELILKVGLILTNLDIVQKNLEGIDIAEIKYSLWGYNFNRTFL